MPRSLQLPNGQKWKSLVDAKHHFKVILGRSVDGKKITPKADHNDVCALAVHYDKARAAAGKDGKIGPGIKHMSWGISRGVGYSTPCFQICRTDGKVIEFSYLKAITSKSPVAALIETKRRKKKTVARPRVSRKRPATRR